jgi:hypothetical protein
LTLRPELDEPQRQRPKTQLERQETLAGRFKYGDFLNPDTRMAVQEAAQKNAALEGAQRRAQATAQASRHQEYDSTKHIERAATARLQRLAAEKRNTKQRSKAK